MNPNLGQEALDEFERVVRDEGMQGLKLMAPQHGYQISSAVCDPLMETARSLGIPVTIHSQGTPAHPLEIAELAKRHPEVPMIMDHMGHRYWVNQALQAARACDNFFFGDHHRLLRTADNRARRRRARPPKTLYSDRMRLRPTRTSPWSPFAERVSETARKS